MQHYRTFQTELELLPIILLLEEYRIPYEQQANNICLPKAYHSKFDKILVNEQTKLEDFIYYNRYNSKILLENMTQLLEHHAIPFKVIVQNSSPEEVYSMKNPIHIFYHLHLKSKDFTAVNDLLKEQARQHSIYKAADYHLRGLSDQELIDIIETPDAWHIIDVFGAQHLLKERAIIYTDEDLELMRLHKMILARKPKKISRLSLFRGYFLAFILGIWGIFEGLYYTNEKTILPNGRKVLTFDTTTRKHGKYMMMIGFVWIILLITSLLTIRLSGI